MKYVFLFHLKCSFHSRDILIFVILPLPFRTFQIQRDKWKWNNLCHELTKKRFILVNNTKQSLHARKPFENKIF